MQVKVQTTIIAFSAKYLQMDSHLIVIWID